MSHLHDLVAAANARIAASPRAGEIEWIVSGNNMKLIYTERFEKENGMRMRSGAEQERRRAAYRQGEADAVARQGPAEQDALL